MKIVDTLKSCAGVGKNHFLSHDNANSKMEQQKTNQTTILSHAKRTTEVVKWPAKRNEPCTRDSANRKNKGKATARDSEPEHVHW